MTTQEPSLDFAALSIDSNILRGQRYNFDGGILKQLEQFKGSPVQILQPDVIHSEGIKHLASEITDALRAARSNLRTLAKYALFDNIQNFTENSLGPVLSAPALAEAKLNSFYERINARVISSSSVQIQDLMNMYFNAEPPFETASDKKHEFPDAIALLALKAWAVSENKRTVVVSKDKGWHAFAQNLQHLHVVGDLAEALALFQPHTKVAKLISLLQAEGMLEHDSHLFASITNAIAIHTTEQMPEIEANAVFNYEYDDFQIVYLSHKFAKPEVGEKPRIRIVLIKDDLVVLSLSALVLTEVMATFSFSQYDSIDKDYVSLGGTVEERPVSYEADVLIHFRGDWKHLDQGLKPSKIEIVGTMQQIHFGDIGPDYSNDRDDDIQLAWEQEQEYQRRRDDDLERWR
ncbi:hypothetical protein CFBP1590__5098 [Pseudomonas viridiflava]|uniref:DUF4935 domain-containing protein n=2 Tax=Pseudomonas syringae group TaxID=136849 RepID=A0A1Y6JS64_PSEVI|nr:PIN domain-containing protein [Pseudomonas viridiflava]SMS12684.1 hypothetical protein CFBP1590__5098 [Pseudomonas viridiflava]